MNKLDTISKIKCGLRPNCVFYKTSSNGCHYGAFFKPEKNLEFFRLKNCPIDDYPGKLEWLAVNNLVYFWGKFWFGL